MNAKKLAGQIGRHTPYVKNILQNSYYKSRDINILNIEKQELINQLSDDNIRNTLSRIFIKGSGIEIGALHMPLKTAPGVTVKYVDYLSVKSLRKQYPELDKLPLVDVAIVDNGETLTKVKPNSVDFIVANHFLEHCQDPIGSVLNFYTKLRVGGVMFMAIPNKTFTFDMDRPVTKYTHLLEEHRIYPERKFFANHCLEIAKHTNKLKGVAAKAKASSLVNENYSIHHHVWTEKEMIEMFHNIAADFSVPIRILAAVKNLHEYIFIIERIDTEIDNSTVKDLRSYYFA